MLKCLDLVMNSVDYIAVIDSNYNMVFNTRYETQVNTTAQHIKRSEYVKQKYYETYPELDLETSTIMRSIRTGEIVVGKNQSIKDFQGRVLCTDNITIPIIRKGRIMGAIELARDVTTAKAKEDKRANSFDHLADVIRGKSGEITFDSILTKNKRMRHTIEYAKTLADLPNHTLIYGETGTGKELFAQAMIAASGVPKSKVVIENCAAIPENLFEPILFGSTKGAFTGAENHKGLLEDADGGILFLDELNAMPYAVQGKLLRVMQEGTFRTLGSNTEKKVNVKIIAAMNVDPDEAIAANTLRRDLFYRFSSSVIYVPRLRDRKEDITLFLDTYLEEYADAYGKNITGYDKELETLLKNYTWEGNVRELKHLVESMVAIAKGSTLGVEDLPEYVYQRIKKGMPKEEKEAFRMQYSELDMNSMENFDLRQALEEREREIIAAVLKHCGGNKTRASRILGIPRPTLLYKIEKLKIEQVSNS